MPHSEFWALRDVSFDVQSGEVLGIIGRNGAGKSTLLKILSRVTSPTTGRVEIHGRIASLLEVGTGFHPELTGRENVYLNGTILGMSKREIDRQFDTIVDFSGVARFIHTPVKRYSSGMTVRLAFAVAAHLNPEILVVDEVLAVGDIEFQKRCVRKMQDVANSGRTVLFVSHNLASIRALTMRTLVLSQGSIRFNGPTEQAVAWYSRLNAVQMSTPQDLRNLKRPFPGLNREIEFLALELEAHDSSIEMGSALKFKATLLANESVGQTMFGVTVFRDDDSPVGSAFSQELSPIPRCETRSYHLAIESIPLAPGRYYCAISVADARSPSSRLYDSLAWVLPFEVREKVLSCTVWRPSFGCVRLPIIHVRQEGTFSANRPQGEE